MATIYYNMKFSVADVARILKTERGLIKSLAYRFSKYLSKNANPAKGISHEFTLEDMRVMAYVLMYWEDEPDMECIRMELNSNEHFKNNLINELKIGRSS